MTNVPTPHQVVSDGELFARNFLWIRDRRKRLVRFKWNAAQRHFDQNRTGRDLVLKARQLGFSTVIQGEQFRRLVTKTSTTLTLAHDNDTTQKLRRMSDRFWQNCKFGDIQPKRQYSNAALATYPELDSASIIGTAGSVQKGRGDTYTDIHGSEVAFWKDAESIIIGASEGGRPDIVLESTPNGTQGYFYELCMEALDGNSPWTLHFYPWWWEPSYWMGLRDGEVIEYTEDELEASEFAKQGGFAGGLQPEQIKWRRDKISVLKDKFAQEHPEDPTTCFLASGDSYFGNTSTYFGASFGVTWNPEHRYSGGLDFAQANDYLVLSISDRTLNCQVDQLRVNKLEWKELRSKVYDMYCRWSWESGYWGGLIDLGQRIVAGKLSPDSLEVETELKQLRLKRKEHEFHILAESNSIGSVNIEALRSKQMGVDKFISGKHPELLPLFDKGQIFGSIKGMPIHSFATTAASKADLMSDMKEALETDGYQLLPLASTKHEYNIFVATQTATGYWRLAAQEGGHDDTVIATALDNRAGTTARTTRLVVR